MSLKIAEHLFSGPYDLDTTVVRSNQRACVYALISREGKPYDPRFRVLFVADSAGKRIEFANHPDRAAWEDEASGALGVYLYRPDIPEPAATDLRLEIVDDILRRYTPPKGVISIDGMV